MFAQQSASGTVVPCVIDGEAVSLAESQNFAVVQGKTGDVVHYAQSATVEVGVKAVEAAGKAFKSWKRVPVIKRRDILLRAADILEKRTTEATKRCTTETSCDDHWPSFDCSLAATMIRQNVATAMTVAGRIPPADDPLNTSLVFKEPVGVVLIIPPWNAVMIMACRGISAALAAGCTVVLKASELSPWSHQLILEVFKEAGLPDGVLNQIQCSRTDAPAVTEAIIGHPLLRKIEFVGSPHVGRIIGSVAAKHLKPVLMELGDQSPAIILEDADLKAAAEKCVFGVIAHHGQVCFGTERLLVQEKVKDAFVEELIEAMRATPSGGSAVTAEGARRVHDLIAETVSDGAELLIGKNQMTGRSSLEPTIVTQIKANSRFNREETWGPAASLSVFTTDDEAIEVANSTDFGLSASIFTKDYARALRMARDLDFGQVQVNTHTLHVNSTSPVTGCKASGWGSNGGGYGVEEFMFNKHVCLCP
ncbi:hypothetical protein AYL99_11482 [Fonsecaea erecta]|uniref:Aldehyde dehydrogenase domain-containing protein n=1 Tax=Fonsecaea erecta TaxID=1367422 RepID=A0A178Z4B3_9EURO|nr:hypothetical protein AYL99_11482 [Fonsecaea erecta]OAP54381.1 hypothetical protein AYL99_11482 [Fonsecaea erecta]